MFRFQPKILLIVISFLLLAAWLTIISSAASPLTTGTESNFVTQSNFIDSGQKLGGNVESSAVALGDLDADGDLDAVVASFGGFSRVYLNQGGNQGGTEGVFKDSGQSLSPMLAVDVELKDLDGDTDLDLFLVKDAFGDANEVWLNQGVATGIFTQTDQTFGDSLSTSVALGDLDGVNGSDAFVSRGFGQPSKVWFNSGSGTFSDSGQMLDTDSSDITLGDLDGDNDLDVFSANSGDNKIWVNQGGTQMGVAGIFLDSGQLLTSTLSLSADLGDVDSDGDLDVWVGNSDSDRVWVNQGGSQGATEGVFLEGATPSPNQTRDVVLGDLDGDGDLDSFLAKRASNEVWINQGGNQSGNEGDFKDSGQNLGNSMSEGLALGDVDGDGDLDAFVVNWGQPDRIWLNQTPPPTPQADVSLTVPPTDYSSDAHVCAAGAQWHFQINVHNAGPNPATNVTASTDLGTFSGLSVVHNFGTLAPGESASITLNSVPDRGVRDGPVYCKAEAHVQVSADQEDPDLNNNGGRFVRVWFTCNEPCAISKYLCPRDASGQISNSHDENHILTHALRQRLQSAIVDLLVYQFVRDSVLVGTEEGRHYINLYYAHDAEIQSLLGTDAVLDAEAIATLQLWEPNLWALVRGEGDTATITAAQVNAVDSFLTNLSAAGSPELQQTIAAERDRLPLPQEFVGMTIDEARGLVVGYGTYLPLIVNP